MEQRLDRGTPGQRSGRTRGRCSAPTRRPPGRHRTARLPHQRRLLPVRSFPRPTSRVRSSRTRGSRARRWAARVSAGRRRSVRRRVRLPGTSQPKFDVRVDQELSNGGQLSYSGGVAATEGLSHTGVGALDIQRGSYLGYGKLGYTQGDFRFQGLHQHHGRRRAEPPCPTPTTPASQCSCGSRARRSTPIAPPTFLGERNLLTYGGNVRRNIFDITSAPTAPDRLELGAMQAVDLSGLTAFPPLLPPGLPPAVARGRCSSSTRRSRDRFPWSSGRSPATSLSGPPIGLTEESPTAYEVSRHGQTRRPPPREPGPDRGVETLPAPSRQALGVGPEPPSSSPPPRRQPERTATLGGSRRPEAHADRHCHAAFERRPERRGDGITGVSPYRPLRLQYGLPVLAARSPRFQGETNGHLVDPRSDPAAAPRRSPRS